MISLENQGFGDGFGRFYESAGRQTASRMFSQRIYIVSGNRKIFYFSKFSESIFCRGFFHFKVENQLVPSKNLRYHYYMVSYYNTLGHELEIESDDVHKNEKNPRQKFESEIFGK